VNLETLSARTAETIILAGKRAESTGCPLSIEHILLELVSEQGLRSNAGLAIKRAIGDATVLARNLRLAISERKLLIADRTLIMQWTTRETRALNHLCACPEHLLLGILRGCVLHLQRYFSIDQIGNLKQQVLQVHPAEPVSPYALLDRFSSYPSVIQMIDQITLSAKMKDEACARREYRLAREYVRSAAEVQRALGKLLLQLAVEDN
jgi:hypothetical protein